MNEDGQDTARADRDAGASNAGEAAAAAAGGATDGEAASEEQRRREVFERLKRLRVADVVEEMMVGLVTVGYQKLGLTEQTRELRDLAEARLAIETLRAWVDVLARERGEEGLADLRGTVAAMQLSYARAAAEPAGGGAEETSAEERPVEPPAEDAPADASADAGD